MTMKFFVSFREMRPDMFKTDQLRRLYLTIAEHYRSIVLDNKQKQESNLANSIKYIRKHIAVDLENSASEEKIINMIDSFSFIRNYRV